MAYKTESLNYVLGSTMRTVALRPVVVYGELDVHFVPVAIEAGVKNRGIMIDFCGSGY
jgi:hypothetical protein